jgi:hypothetical protein
MNNKFSLKDVAYPPVGIAHITQDLSDLVKDAAIGKNLLHVHCSSQPNGNPHLGTVMTLMTNFALAQRLGNKLNLKPEVKFEEIDNAPSEKIIKNGITYSRSVKQDIEEKVSKNEKFMNTYHKIFQYLNKKSNVKYSIRSYSEYQKLTFSRKMLIKILNEEYKYIPLFSPSEEKLHIRIQCPECGYIDKSAVNLKKEKIREDEYKITNLCFEHGEFTMYLNEDSIDFIDTNTPITDVIQGATFIEEDKKSNALSIMVDGNDWSGVWSLNVFSKGLEYLGYPISEQPFHFYSPLVTDWSGAKFSKSVYVTSDTYNYLPKEFVNFEFFLKNYGDMGMDILWEEAQNWVSDPKKNFLEIIL